MARFRRNRMYRDRGWLGVAVADTDDPLRPQPFGIPRFGMINPEFVVNQFGSQVTSGNQFVMTETGLAIGARFYIPVIDPDLRYNLFVRRIEAGFVVNLLSLSLPSEVTTPGWYEPEFSALLEEGQTIQAVVGVTDASGTPDLNESWIYSTPSQTDPPTTGQWNHNNQHTIVRIHQLANNGTNQVAQLLAIQSGHFIEVTFGETLWRYRVNAAGSLVNEAVIFDNIVRVSDDGSLAPGDLTLLQSFSPGLGQVSYVEDAAFWSTSPVPPPWATASGIFQTGGEPLFNDTGYGADIQIQRLDVSPDWEFAAISPELGF